MEHVESSLSLAIMQHIQSQIDALQSNPSRADDVESLQGFVVEND
jgi:hypothetical protein